MRKHSLVITVDGTLARVQFLILSIAALFLRQFKYHGIRKACRALAPFFHGENSVIIADDRRKFRIYLADPYWIRYAFCGFAYEVEIEHILDATLDDQSVFIDCGANTGYWSIYAATKIHFRDHVLAIEPVRTTFGRLSENMELNNKSFTVIRKAIFSNSHCELQFRTNPTRHDSSTCVLEPTDSKGDYWLESATAITIDELFDQMDLAAGEVSGVVIKLDVEGAEREAIRGAQRLISEGALLIYEDHGRDLSCATTDVVLSEWGLEVYFLRPQLAPLRIETVSQIASLKKSATTGYNLVAARNDSPLLQRLLTKFGIEAVEAAVSDRAFPPKF